MTQAVAMPREAEGQPNLNSRRSITSGKHAGPKSVRSKRLAVTWPDIVGCLLATDTRSLATKSYRAQGWDPDQFATLRLARVAMANALTSIEDWLESEHPRRTGESVRIRQVRRRLELELWP